MTLSLHLGPTFALSMIAAGAYFGTASLLWKNLAVAYTDKKTTEWRSYLWVFAMAVHGMALFHLLYTSQGLDMAFFKSASLVSLIMVFFLFLSCRRNPLEILASVILPLTAVLLLIAYFSTNQHIIPIATRTGVQVHIVLSLLAYSLLSFAALQAVVLAWQDHQLRKNPSHFLIACLPPLDAMEAFLLTLINSGFVLLSAGIITGWLYHEDIFAQHLAHKTVFAIIAWLIFAVLIGGRQLYRWRGTRIVHLTILGIFFLVLAYFGSKLVLEYILQGV